MQSKINTLEQTIKKKNSILERLEADILSVRDHNASLQKERDSL